MQDVVSPKRVLVVSYFYPPFQSVGALRVSKVTKHLAALGWRPIVLTVAGEDLPRTMDVEIPEADVHRAACLDVNRGPKLLLGRRRVASRGYQVFSPGLAGTILKGLGETYRRWLNFPDGQIGWYPFAVREGLRVIREEAPVLIYSSAPPATGHLVAARLAALTGVPWVGEFRDPWTDNPNYDRAPALRSLERRLEERVMSTARAIVAVTPDRATQLGQRFGKPVVTVTNAYDREDYPRDTPLLPTFTITFTGMVYPGRQTARPLFDAIARLAAAAELPEGFLVRLVGRNVQAIADEARAAGVAAYVRVFDQVDRRAALAMQVESTLLLLLLWTEGGDAWYPAKMFEYLGAERPILALGPASNEGARLVAERNAGLVSLDAGRIEDALRAWLALYRKGGTTAITGMPAPQDLDRRAQVEKLAEVFARVTAPDARAG